MRNRITDYTFTDGGRTITLTKFAAITVADIRLIVNETQKVVICSSMQKDLVSCSGNTITFANTLPALADGDQLTIEVDTGKDVIYSGGTDWVVYYKNNSLLPVFEQEEWEITYEMGEQLKNIVEADRNVSEFSVGATGLFAYSKCIRADLSSWTKIAGDRMCQYTFYYCSFLSSVDLSNITEIKQTNACYSMFQNCVRLVSIDLSSLRSVSGTSVIANMFMGCTSLTYMNVNVEVLSANGATNIVYGINTLMTVKLVGTPTKSIYLLWQPNLNYESVKGILTLLASSTVSGKSCNFYSSTLHIEDHITEEHPNGELYDLATAATTAGWTINNLSID